MEKRELVGFGVLLALGLAAYAAQAGASTGGDAGAGGPAPPQPGDGSGGGLAFPDFTLTPLPGVQASTEPSSPYTPFPVEPVSPTPAAAGDLNAQVAALLALIRTTESGGDYTVLYGGGHFADYSRHPDVRVPFYDPKKAGPAGVPNNFSTAAGAYQINWPTWNTEIQPALSLPDFSPASQDQAALFLLKKTGAYNALADGDVQGAIQAAAKRWASLPGSSSGQHQVAMQSALDVFSANGGTVA